MHPNDMSHIISVEEVLRVPIEARGGRRIPGALHGVDRSLVIILEEMVGP